ncbi:hypothetical protein NKDENANG_00078 [Candidatus Entotheonellaceae bacterium PAL068K]
MINILELEPGATIRLDDEATAEVVSNPRDGVWIVVRYVTAPQDPAQVGTEEMIFAEKIIEQV